MQKTISMLAAAALTGCASTTAYYPPLASNDGRWRSQKAFQTYGDSLGSTSIDVTTNGVHYAAAGGNDNSTTTGLITREAGRTARYGISWGFSWAILKSLFSTGASAYNTSQSGTTVVTQKPPPAPAPELPVVGSTIPAQVPATVVIPGAVAP